MLEKLQNKLKSKVQSVFFEKLWPNCWTLSKERKLVESSCAFPETYKADGKELGTTVWVILSARQEIMC